mmetsp:Transcript_21297/g.30818  ORF Transcript_21297/g.30818 Transcript_21297/m.30818 type:complete len:332 (+) Transcript_21297:60-1055(+)|eukprot:CAMPEP_0185018234 /NCGR_PEP_ID=MMETSP1103-20130426/1024_1 /TAXON_ID=36769 /ORGANISM="Paraphysomonas bandaiensis, Strain Caron Lab Isolate" /LENGTH=331 /DNA_ID=CAMNT_0027547975 /DNA_START=9 /DNA_END=1004 /DNA_ORIENTATION=+
MTEEAVSNPPDDYNSSLTDSSKKRKHTESSPSEGPSEARNRAQKFLQPFSSDQIFNLMLDIAENIPEAMEMLEDLAQTDITHRKLFIRGLSWETTDDHLRAVFSPFGEIEEAAVVVDRATGRNKGYGFVIFKDMDAAYAALEDPTKEIDGKSTRCNLAALGVSGNGSTGGGHSGRGRSASFGDDDGRSIETRKLFIRGLDYNTTVDELKAVFQEYGEIEDCTIPSDRATGRSKGFAFLTFKQSSAASDALHMPTREIGGRTVNVHLATHGPRGGSGGRGHPGGDMGPGGFMGPPGGGFMGPPQGGFPPMGGGPPDAFFGGGGGRFFPGPMW